VFFAFGHFVVRMLKLQEKDAYNFADVFFIGLCMVGTLLTLFSLWIPLTNNVLLFLFIISITYLIYAYKKGKLSLLTDTFLKMKHLPLLYKILFAFFVLVIAFYCLLPPGHFDTGLYHWQAMMWSEAYPAVPGLANINSSFGLNSTAISLHSVFSLQDIYGVRVFGLNGLLLIILFGWIVFRMRKSGLICQLALILFVFLFLRFYDVFLSSPATDIIPNIIISYLLLRSMLDYHSIITTPLLYWVLPIFCLTLKLSVAPFCLFNLIVFAVMMKNKQYKMVLISIAFGCVLLIPWFVKNVILSGYLIYPVTAIDIFNVDWKEPASVVDKIQKVIKSWAKASNADFEYVSNLSFIELVKVWLLRYLKYSKTAVLTCGLAAISPFVILFTQRIKLINKPFRTYPWLIAAVGTLFWAVVAPDVRFGFGYIAFMAFAPFMLMDHKIESPFLKKIPLFLIFAFLIFFTKMSFTIIKNTRDNRTYSSFLYKPNTIDYMVRRMAIEYTTYKMGDIEIYVPVSSTQCYNHKIPCTLPDRCLDCMELRGKSIREGFRIKKSMKP
jgi:hypothetical protein